MSDLFTAAQLEAKKNPAPVRFHNRYEKNAKLPGAGMTIAKRVPPFGLSPDGMRHRVDEVCIIWVAGSPVLAVKWECGEWTDKVTFADPADAPECVRCRFRGHFVYYVRNHNGFIKIGFSKQLPKRLKALKAELLAIEPGDRFVEKQRHTQFQSTNAVGEWFAESPALLDLIATLKAQYPFNLAGVGT